MSRRLVYPPSERGWIVYERVGGGFYPPVSHDDLDRRIAKAARLMVHFKNLSEDMSYPKWERDAFRKLSNEEKESLEALSTLKPKMKRIIFAPTKAEMNRVLAERNVAKALKNKLEARRKLARKGWWKGGYASPSNQWKRKMQAKQRQKK